MDPRRSDDRHARDFRILEWLTKRYGRHGLVMILAKRGRQLRDRPELLNEPRMAGLLQRAMLELAGGAIRVEEPPAEDE